MIEYLNESESDISIYNVLLMDVLLFICLVGEVLW